MSKILEVSLNEIQEMFNDLIQEKKAREEIADWASQRQQADDEDNLEFQPQEERKKIWRALIYLMGVDLLDMDGSYLHSIENFIDFRNNIDL